MAENETGGRALPMSLSSEDLPKTEIVYAFYSAKTGAGVQEIHVHGTGEVVLRKTRSRTAEPETREGRIAPEAVVRLLELMEDQGFRGLEDLYPAEGHPHARRMVSIAGPSLAKKVAADEPVCPEFERITGAISLAAGIAVPEALGHRFFPNL